MAKVNSVLVVLAVGVITVAAVSVFQRASTTRGDQLPPVERVVPLPTADLSRPDVNVFTIFDRAGPDAPVRLWRLAVGKDVAASITGIGLIEDGQIVKPEQSPGLHTTRTAIALILYNETTSTNLNSLYGANTIYINNRFLSESLLANRQNTYRRNCKLESYEYGLFKSVDADKDHHFKSCDFQSGRFLSDADFNADDIIDCGPTGGGRCTHAFSYQNWDVSVIYRQSELPRWRIVKMAVMEYLGKITVK